MAEFLHELVKKREGSPTTVRPRLSAGPIFENLIRDMYEQYSQYAMGSMVELRAQQAINTYMESNVPPIGYRIAMPMLSNMAATGATLQAEYVTYRYTGDPRQGFRGWVRA